MSILSLNNQPPLVIDDSNWRDFVPDQDGIVHTPDGPRLTGLLPQAPGETANIIFTDWDESGLTLFDDQELAERLEDQWASSASIMHRVYHTDSLYQKAGTCWIHGTCQAATMLLEMANLPFRYLSPASVAYYCYPNFGTNGGWPRKGVEQFQAKGACTVDVWPENGFSKSYDTEASRSQRLHNWLVEVVYAGSGQMAFRRLLSAHCQGKPGGATFNWWAHYVSSCYGRENGGELQLGIRNTWGNNGYGDKGFGLIGGSRKYPDEAYIFLRMRQSPGSR